ncbi:MAG: D-2-hydroxyacid dehydrogenase [Anaerolineales bacterium]|nr:D-2-hydroxyacid dehydrogenase [Anaerolineales bacterium]NUQ84456.1 D-2-hydroxyacid dehydrogenase [Anaerolineales bacterium]
MPKLLILSREPDEYKKLIRQADLPDLEIVAEFAECDVVLGEPRIIREHLPQLPNVKWIQSMYAGVEALTDPTLRRDYVLTNARGVFGELMSEYVFGYMLAHEKKIFERFKAQQAKKWDRFESGLLRGKTLGLLGVGSIGAHLAGTAKHFGMTVWGYSRGSERSTHVDRYFHPPPQPSPGGRGGIIEFANGLDYLVVVLPRTKDTDKIVDANLLDALPPHAILLNVGRGNAVDESALVEALEHGKIAGAVLDVTEKEPLPKDHPFWVTPNLLLTFHTSAMSYPEDITKLFVENYRLYIEGKPLKYRVDFERGY